jgi:hypothetical protein
MRRRLRFPVLIFVGVHIAAAVLLVWLIFMLTVQP